MELLSHREYNSKSGIYCITNLVNGKRYIGYSNNLYDRISWHITALKLGSHHCDHLQKAINKYGMVNFNAHVLELCSRESLRKREIYYMKEFNTNDHSFGYNMTDIREDVQIPSLESRMKQSLAMKGRAPIKALEKSAQNRLDGMPHPLLGRKHSIETLEKLRVIREEMSPEKKRLKSERCSISGKMRGTNYQSKACIVYDTDFNIIKEYNSAKECSKDYPEISYSTLLKKFQKESCSTYKDRIFRYKTKI